MQIPITNHPKLPEGVPLVADFNDDRNRLSYYFPILENTDGIRVPITKFFPVEGNFNTHLQIEYREITSFMQDLGIQEAFVRGDFCSGKYEGEKGSKIDSQDPYDIEQVILDMVRQIFLSKRNLGGRIAVREWIPHDAECRYFIREGRIIYEKSLDDVPKEEFPYLQAATVAETLDTFSWSADFIRHETTGKWYCTDMGLDGLYFTGDEWIDISEHLEDEYSSEGFADEMPHPKRFRWIK